MPEPTAYLLDTGVLIIYARGKAAAEEMETHFHFIHAPFKPIVSAVTIGEVYAFAQWHEWGPTNLARLERLLLNLVVLDISNPEIVRSYAAIYAACRSNGWTLGDNDRWIAATAQVTSATLLTTDKDFDPMAGTLLDRIRIDPNSGKTA